MNLSTARAAVQRCCERMNSLYGQLVFDEWAIVALTAQGAQLAAYEGPRLEQFRARFVADSHAIQAIVTGRPFAIGEFVFAPAAEGTAFDACVRIGEQSYLLFNHTQRTMDDIRRDPRWLQAQRAFLELSESFLGDPAS